MPTKTKTKQVTTKGSNRQYTVHYRPGTTDENALEEVLTKRVYRRPSIGLDVEPGDLWLDLGANIGAFAVYCLLKGASTVSYEPDPDCFTLLQHNAPGCKLIKSAVTTSNEPSLKFYRSADPTNHYRNTALAGARGKSGPYEQYDTLRNTYVDKVLTPPSKYRSDRKKIWDGCKMDIEGSELDMLDANMIPHAHKLVMEYHINRDQKNMVNFRERMDYLRELYTTVAYSPSLDRMGDKYTGRFDFIVYCTGLK